MMATPALALATALRDIEMPRLPKTAGVLTMAAAVTLIERYAYFLATGAEVAATALTEAPLLAFCNDVAVPLEPALVLALNVCLTL